MESIYTRTGDDGETGLLGEGRVWKDHPRIEAVGSVDEATAALGVARAACVVADHADLILTVQRELYRLMAELSATPENAARFRAIDESRVAWLEAQTDALTATMEPPRDFILPGDSPAGAALAMARTIVRRAERRLAPLLRSRELENVQLLRYLNRLSSLCFALELAENRAWTHRGSTLAKTA